MSIKGNTDSNINSLLEGLNRSQLKAVKHGQGPAMVIAGAGTGKTRVITTRIAYLIQSQAALPEQILALTFTDKAAAEMERRVDQLLPYGYVETQIMTFHALGSHILKQFSIETGMGVGMRLATPLQQHVLMRQALDDLPKLQILRPRHNPLQFAADILSYISRLKDEAIGPLDYSTWLNESLSILELNQSIDVDLYQEVGEVYNQYEEIKKTQNLIDFGDQLMLPFRLMKQHPHIRSQLQKEFKYILVDEFQDTNRIQAELLYLLSEKQQNLMVVGDDDQSIYRFRGAELQNILNFNEHYKSIKTIVLSDNYRSTQQILDASYELIQHNNPDRLEAKLGVSKRLQAQIQGQPPKLAELDNLAAEISFIVKSVKNAIKINSNQSEMPSMAILTRNNKQAGVIIQALRQAGISVAQSQNSQLLHQPIVRQCIDFLRILHDPDDSPAMYRWLISPKIDHDPALIIQYSAEAKRHQTSLNNSLSQIGNDIPISLKNSLLSLESYRQLVKDHTAGEILYKFVTSDNYLDNLVELSKEDTVAVHQVQALAAFFGLITELEALGLFRDTASLWDYIQDMYSLGILEDPDENEAQDGVHVLTIHRAKGLEFDRVWLFDMTEGSFPATRKGESLYLPHQLDDFSTNDLTLKHYQEERRLGYVAFTRAKTDLTLTFSRDHGGKRARKPSRFLLEAFPDRIAQLNLSHGTRPATIERHEPSTGGSNLLAYPQDEAGWISLTPNQVADYLEDPARFYVRNVLHFPELPSHRLIYGTAIHAALEYYFRLRQTGKQPNIADVQAVFKNLWSQQGFVSLRHAQDRYSNGLKVLDGLVKQYNQQDIQVVGVEEPFEVRIDHLKLRLRGRIDLVIRHDNGVEIRDFKTSAVANQKYALNKVRDTIQIHIYALAWQMLHKQPVQSVSLEFVDANILANRSKIDNEKTVKKLTEVVNGIRAGKYPNKSHFANLESDGLI